MCTENIRCRKKIFEMGRDSGVRLVCCVMRFVMQTYCLGPLGKLPEMWQVKNDMLAVSPSGCQLNCFIRVMAAG